VEFLFLLSPFAYVQYPKMSGGRWKQVRAALARIGVEAMQYDADGIDMCFINSTVHRGLLKVSDPGFFFVLWPR
jgi:hypothetical protein